MVYSWFMCTLQHWTRLLVFLLTSTSNKSKTIGTAPHDIPDLPSDVIVDILSRLPAECVLKCRQVCKMWLVLTSSPHFAEIHRKRAVPVVVFQMATQFKSNAEAINLHIFDDDATGCKLKMPRIGSLKIDGSGLVILYGSGNGFLVFRRTFSRYNVLNPVTREHDTIELPPVGKEKEQPLAQMSSHWTWCGIVFHFGIGENILIFWRAVGSGKFFYCTYMLSSKLWKQASTSSYRPKDKVGPIIFNDRLHWMSASSYCSRSIISCDMNVEGFRSMPHPGKTCAISSPKQHEYMYLLEHEGKLAFGNYRDPSFDIWVLEDYDTWSWSLKYNVNLYRDVRYASQHLRNINRLSRVAYWRIINCELIFDWYWVGIFGYHLERKTTRRFDAPSLNSDIKYHIEGNALPYTKCLISLCNRRVS